MTGDDKRPEFRVALFGVGEKFERMLEIVARHARHNRYRFRLSTDRSASSFDIALVDMTVPGGPEVARTLQKLLNGRPVIQLGRRQDEFRGRDSLTHDTFAGQVMQALNRFVEKNLAAQAGVVNRFSAAFGNLGIDAEPALEESIVADSRRPRALIVDDSPTVRRQLAIALGQMGMDSEAVSSGQEALELLALREYELVFADVVMPEQDGYQLTRQIKRDKSLKGLPVIILTSRSSPFDLAKGALAGCSSYLVKPVSLQSLRDTVSRQLERAIAVRHRSVELIGLAGSA
ncbi:MAG: response regulator [Burkholderiaceae bacterium]